MMMMMIMMMKASGEKVGQQRATIFSLNACCSKYVLFRKTMRRCKRNSFIPHLSTAHARLALKSVAGLCQLEANSTS